MELLEIIEEINKNSKWDLKAKALAEKRQEQLAKPTGALGDLEDMSIKLSAITGKVENHVTKQAILVFCSDNGVVSEGVASAPQTVTSSQTVNFLRHYTGMSALANSFNIDIMVLDMGVKDNIPNNFYTKDYSFVKSGVKKGEFSGKIVDRKLRRETRNLYIEDAMTKEETLRAILIGIEAVKKVKDEGYDIFGVGEMGIGNTTTSSCLVYAFTGTKPEDFIGRGGGLNDDGLKKKIKVVKESVDRINIDVKEEYQLDEVISVLTKVGGYDIAGMVGAYLGAAYYKLPVVVDGYISIVSAMVASLISKNVIQYMFLSHESKELGYLSAMKRLGLKPMFNLGMRLGEGSGCPIAFKILEAATNLMNEMATYSEGAIDSDYLLERNERTFF